MGIERREHKRVAARFTVSLFDGKGNARKALARNLSLGGLGVEADFSINDGAQLMIEFTIPLKKGFLTIRTKVKVVNVIYRGAVQKMAIGMSFLNLDHASAEGIRDYARGRQAI